MSRSTRWIASRWRGVPAAQALGATQRPFGACWRPIHLFIVFLLLICSLSVHAQTQAQTQTLDVRISGVRGAVEENVRAFLSLWPLREESVTSPSRLRYLHRKAPGEIERALQPYGYYRPRIQGDLRQSPQGWVAEYRIEPGERIPVVSLDLQILGEARDDRRFERLLADPPLSVGDPLVHGDYETFKSQLRSLAAERGYYDARLTRSRVEVDLDSYEAAVELHFDSGPRFHIGTVEFGPSPLSEKFLARYLPFAPEDPVRTRKLVELQTALIDSGYFRQVEVSPRWAEARDNRVPIEVILEANKRTQYRTGIGYGTDTGARGKLGMTRRWVNDRGHQLDAQVLASEIRSSFTAEYGIPGERPQRDHYAVRLDFTDENSDSIDASRRSVGVSWQQQGDWQRLLSLEWQQERFRFGDETQRSEFLIPRIDLSYVSARNRLQVRDGYRLSLTLLGGSESLLSDTDFLQARLGGKLVHSLSSRWRLLGRAEAGETTAGEFDALPATLRFFAGGDSSVRGYGYQSLSPRNSDGEQIGGARLLLASAEVDYRFRENWALAAFIDQGDAFDGSDLDLRTGIGIGLRWFSPVGPVRLDIAAPQDSDADGLRLHFSLGPDL